MVGCYFFDTLWEAAGDGVVHVSMASSGSSPGGTGRQSEPKCCVFNSIPIKKESISSFGPPPGKRGSQPELKMFVF